MRRRIKLLAIICIMLILLSACSQSGALASKEEMNAATKLLRLCTTVLSEQNKVQWVFNGDVVTATMIGEYTSSNGDTLEEYRVVETTVGNTETSEMWAKGTIDGAKISYLSTTVINQTTGEASVTTYINGKLLDLSVFN